MMNYQSPDFHKIQSERPSYLEIAKKYDEDGYLIIDLDLQDHFVSQIKNHILEKVGAKDYKKNPDIYHYNESPRIVEAWKTSKEIKNLALNETVIDLLTYLYSREPLPFSTINFIKGTEQPFHSDYIHFGSIPELYLAGAWVALEDISPNSGPLSIIRKSHKLTPVFYSDLGIDKMPKNIKEIKEFYSIYEEYLKNQISDLNLEVVTPKLHQGECLIWAANMYHGAQKINDSMLTRWSQVTHYHFKGCEFFYNPNFSNHEKKIFARRPLEDLLVI